MVGMGEVSQRPAPRRVSQCHRGLSPRLERLSALSLFFAGWFTLFFLVALRINLPSVLAAVLVLGFGGCVEPVAEIRMSGSVTVTIVAPTKQTSGKALLGNEVVIVLPPPKVAGYVWQITAHNARFLRQRSEITPVTGGAGESRVSFVAIQIGGTKVRFALVAAANQAEIAPVDIQEVALTIE